ncbi:AEC family transporter [Thermosediminibacter litoriperuensis]|uniref:Uncharacterized protein n=1 Tax=Thermosediminibacter litoriperuensis TaxID=291989 RepID=A0A5S5AXX0_9FIRM|nr:AEC family transporter [Thermosediminibacter litoriperuensis]TYP56749.1 hypothetical protein LZ11_00805 [Thermosediminibacter litoriperuensis]
MGNSKLYQAFAKIFIFASIGYFLSRKKIFEERDTEAIAKLLLYITSPALIVFNMTQYFTRDVLLQTFVVPFFSILMVVVSIAGARVAGKFLRIDNPAKLDVFYLTIAFCNTVYLGYPVIDSLYGETAAGYVFFYEFGSAVILWSFGVWLASRENDLSTGTVSLKENLKNLLNPPLTALAFSILLIVLGVKLSGFSGGVIKTLGDITVPLSMLFIGMSVGRAGISQEVLKPEYIAASLIRLIISPLIIGGVAHFVDIPVAIKKVITVEAAMPSMMFTAILAARYGKHPDFAAKIVVITTIFSMVTLPVVAYILQLVY